MKRVKIFSVLNNIDDLIAWVDAWQKETEPDIIKTKLKTNREGYSDLSIGIQYTMIITYTPKITFSFRKE